MTRTLTLKREPLADLTVDELRDVIGGARSGLSCPLTDCFVESRLGTCYSWACE